MEDIINTKDKRYFLVPHENFSLKMTLIKILISINLCVLGGSVYTFLCGCVHICWRSEVDTVFLHHSPSYFLIHGLSLIWNSSMWLDWMATELKGSVSFLSVTIKDKCHCVWFECVLVIQTWVLMFTQ